MKILKKILLSLLIAASIGAVSTSVLAETDAGRVTYAPAEAIDIVTGKIKVALDAVTSGTEGEQVAELIKDASDASKEINANDKVDIARSKANNILKLARKHAKEAALQEAEQELRNALKAFNDLKSLI
ncbi:hypothetical protein ABXJ76_19070 [Methylobacter sp. G7]|uniref:DUF5667 domain-containing protein n=1 Tax=Candidatus Methylobacter titanis TaxID=3053457 RepID=A0AA43Q3G2_9GAMM|nr:hypothetical protein [Candidatus Methylobacter titanis]